MPKGPQGQKRFADLTPREALRIGGVCLLVAAGMAQIKWPNPYVGYYLGPYGSIILLVIVVGALLWIQRHAPRT